MKMKFLKNLFLTSILLEVLFASIIVIPSVNAQEGQVVLTPTEDTYTVWGEPESNFGDQPFLSINYIEIRNIWLKFNLSEVPDGAIVDSAVLELRARIVPEEFNISAHQCFNNSWSELTLTYNIEMSMWADTNFTWMDQTLVTSIYEWYSWNVTDAVVNASDGIFGGKDMVTVVLIDWYEMHVENLEFSSKESGLYSPKLTVHWSGIIPEFPTWVSKLVVLASMMIAIVAYKRLLKTRSWQSSKDFLGQTFQSSRNKVIRRTRCSSKK